MAGNRTGNVLKNSGASILQRVAQILTQFALRTAFIYILGKEYTGISGLFSDILHVLSLMELGMDSSMVFSLYKPLVEHDVQRISALLKFYKKAFTVIGFSVMAAGAACVPFLGYIVKDVPNIKEDIRYIFLMYVLTTSFSYLLIYRSVLLRADQKSRIVSKWTSIIFISECLTEIVLLLLFRQFYVYLIVHMIATISRNIIVSHKSTKQYPEYFAPSDAKLTAKEKRKLYKDLACLTVYNVSGVAIYSTDSMFISAFVGTVAVAVIGNFSLIITSVRNLVNQVVGATKASIGNLAATSSDDKQELIFNRMNFIAFWVSCLCCTCFFVLLNPFIGDIWFDPSYKVSILIVAVMAANFFIAVMVYPVESFRTANGLFVQGWMRPAIMATLNIILDFFWGRRWGIIGILFATTVSRLGAQVWYDPWLIYRRVFKKSVFPYYMRYISYAVITGISCVSAYYLGEFISIKMVLVQFGIKVLFCLSVPNAIIYAIYRKSDELTYVRGLCGKLLLKMRKKIKKQGNRHTENT